ncbi:MAG TPA: hypothetical protein VMV10_01395 [Pirellulales bacterium]|nr:hypothetical protein [Pirellulales bacterium]
MLTKKQSELLDGIGGKTKHGAPHLSELAECLSDAFGGPRALAETLRDLAADPNMPDWLRTRAYGIVINTVSAASKLEHAEPAIECELLSSDDIEKEAVRLMREALGIDGEMDNDLATVVAAWHELPAATRAAIVDAVKAAQATRSNTQSTGD